MIPVVWHTDRDGIRNRGYFDQGWLEDILAGAFWSPVTDTTFTHRYGFGELTEGDDGAIVIIPARHYITDTERIQAGIDRLGWVLLVLTGDEEGAFPWRDLHHPRMKVWVQTPYPDRHADVAGRIPDFCPPGTRAFYRQWIPDKLLRWSFVGQVNNARREEAIAALSQRSDGLLLPTGGFTLGLPRAGYLSILAGTKVAPCPSGCFTPDTFRLFEALEAGCIPIVDSSAPNAGDVGYWKFLFDEDPPFPVVDAWHPAPIDECLADYPVKANQVSSWWQGYKRRFASSFFNDLQELSDHDSYGASLTVIIPTSPISAHPSLDIITHTINSIRDRLPRTPILIMCDGIRPEQAHYTDTYEEYQRRLHWMCNNVWDNINAVRSDAHAHQANLTQRALDIITTPLVLFVEHDTPLVGTIPWTELAAAIVTDQADVIRLHHEASILDVHRYLMLDDAPVDVCGAPLTRTRQWSQRPHLASAEYYRRILRDDFDLPSEHWMIEDRMASMMESQPWERNRVWIYTPDGDMKRSEHLDARGDDPKWVSS